jgi:DNA (cytosine-5)-methyltransferase 1
MRHGSLFSGIGGFDLAAEWMGWENVFHCEINEFGQRVLNHHWSKAKLHEDIKHTDFTIYNGAIDLLSGGFPCQPFSEVGDRKGVDDERHLWEYMLRAIQQIQPTWIVAENVLGLISISDGLVFKSVLTQMEAEGYEVQPYILSASAVGAPHKRYRVWIVGYNAAYANNARANQRVRGERERTESDSGRNGQSQPQSRETSGNATNANDQGLQGRKSQGDLGEEGTQSHQQSARCIRPNWQDFPTQSPLRGGDDGIPKELDGISIPKWRNESIKAFGNAIIPQIALNIFKAIEQYEHGT